MAKGAPASGNAIARGIEFLVRALVAMVAGGLAAAALGTLVMGLYFELAAASAGRRCGGGDPASLCPSSILDTFALVALIYGPLAFLGGAVILSAPAYHWLFKRKRPPSR